MMEKDEILKQVKETISDKLGVPDNSINPNSRLIEDLGMDSFAAVEIKFLLERKFKLKIENSELASVKDIESIVQLIQNKTRS